MAIVTKKIEKKIVRRKYNNFNSSVGGVIKTNKGWMIGDTCRTLLSNSNRKKQCARMPNINFMNNTTKENANELQI